MTLSPHVKIGAFRLSVAGVRFVFYHVYVACLLGMNGVVLIPRGLDGQVGSNAIFSVSWIAIHAISIFFFFTLSRQNRGNLIVAFFFGLFVLSSMFWSASPLDTLIYGGMMACNIFVASMMANEFTVSDIVKLLARVIFSLVALGLVTYFLGYRQVLYFDTHGRDNFLGGTPIRGFFHHKIMAALYATLGAVCAIASYKGWLRIFVLCVSGFFVLMTGSATGVIVFVFSIAAYFVVYRSVRLGISRTLFFFLVFLNISVACILFYLVWDDLLEFLGRDGTLTGRTLLWELGISAWIDRPIIGWGFNGFLNGRDAESIRLAFAQFRNYEVPHFHNSHIQTMVDFGLIGGIFLTVLLFLVLWMSFGLRNQIGAGATAAVFSIFLTLILASTTMFLFFNYNHFANFILFLLFFALRSMSVSKPVSIQ